MPSEVRMTDAERMKKVLSADKPVLRVIDKLLSGALSPQRAETPSARGAEDLRTCTEREAARMLGVSWSTAHRMVKSGRLQTVVVNIHPRVLVSSVLKCYGGEENEESKEETK